MPLIPAFIPNVPLNSSHREEYLLHYLSDSAKCTLKQATLPVPHSTRSYWLNHPSPAVNELANEGSEGPLTPEADVCIIGSGITGVGAAYYFAEAFRKTESEELRGRKFRVAIIEARDFCSGATGRNGGHLAPNPFLGFKSSQHLYGTSEALARLYLEKHSAASLANLLTAHNFADKVDLVNGGRIELHMTEEERRVAKEDYEAVQRALEAKLGEKDLDLLDGIEWLDEGHMMEVHGTPYPGVRLPSHNLWPMKAVTELYRLASQNSRESTNFSLSLHTNTPVTFIEHTSPEEDYRYTLHTPRGNIKTKIILHATNAYASYLIPHLAPPDFTDVADLPQISATVSKAGSTTPSRAESPRKYILPTRGQIITPRSLVPASILTNSGWVANEDYEYWFPRPVTPPSPNSAGEEKNPLVILGGGREVPTNFEMNECDDSVLIPKVGKVLRGFLPSIFEGRFEEAEPEWDWSGIMGFTPDGSPLVGPIPPDPNDFSGAGEAKYAGQYICAGYSGHGMPRAFACAEAVVSLIMHELYGGSNETWVEAKMPGWLPKHFLTF